MRKIAPTRSTRPLALPAAPALAPALALGLAVLAWLGAAQAEAASQTSRSVASRTPSPIEDPQRIRQAVHDFLTDHYAERLRALPTAGSTQDQARDTGSNEIAIEVGRVDRRLRLPQCTRGLEPFLPPGAEQRNRLTVGIRCTQVTRPWKLYVAARVRVYQDVVVARHPLLRGDLVQADDVALARREVSALRPGFFRSRPPVVGKKLKRALASGAVITAQSVSTPKSIRRGEQVVILARSGGLEVRVGGQALGGGGIGDTIRVRNQRSKRIVEGVIANKGVVHVRM